MSKNKCKHEEWNPCGNDFYSCRNCGILRTSQQVNLYAEKDKQISDLEAKLAEKDEQIWALENQKLHAHNCLNQLKQQLAEKEKEIDELKRFKVTIGTMENNQVDISSTTYTDQSKTEFAIEKLKMVKEIIQFKPPMQTYEEIIKTFMFRIDEIIKELEGK